MQYYGDNNIAENKYALNKHYLEEYKPYKFPTILLD